MDFPSPYCIHSPGKHLRNINIDPSELRENLTWNPIEGYIIRYPYISTNVFRNYMELSESVGPQRKDNIFTWCNSLGLKWISLALIASFPRKTPTQYQHRPIRVEGNFDMKPDRRIYHKISIYFLKCFQKLHGTEWICWTPEKGCNSLRLKWISLALIVSIPQETPTQYQHRPIRVEGNLTWNPIEGYIIRYPYISANVFRNYMELNESVGPRERTKYLPDGIHCV